MTVLLQMLARKVSAALASFAETWTGTTGAAWPGVWTLSSDATTPVFQIDTNAGQLGHLTQGSYRANNATLAATSFEAADCEILVKAKPNTAGYLTVRLRYDADGAGSSYEVERDSGGAGAWYVQSTKYPGPTWTNLGTIGPVGGSADWHWIRFRVEGTAVKAKVWKDGLAEPGSWQIDTTSTAIAGPGQVRLSVGGRSSSISYVGIFDDLTVTEL